MLARGGERGWEVDSVTINIFTWVIQMLDLRRRVPAVS